MTDETTLSGEMPAEAAAPLPETTEPVESAPTQPETTPDDAGDDKPKGGFQRRIDELTKNWREEQRRNDALLQALMQQRPQAAPTPAPEPQQPTKPPTLEEHGYDEAKYQAALIEYVNKQAESVFERRMAEAEKARKEQARIETFASRQAEFAKSTPDFADKVLRDPTLPITEAMRDLIIDADNGPELAYWLAQNRDQAEKIASLPERLQTFELGRVANLLEAKKAAPAAAKPAPVVTKAPPPPPTVETTGTESVKVSTTDPASDAMPTDEWIKAEMKRMAKKAKTHG